MSEEARPGSPDPAPAERGPRRLEAVAPARDGAPLATTVRLPEGGGPPLPATLVRTPYMRTNELVPVIDDPAAPLATVLQDVRGRFGSPGAFSLGAGDVEDGAAAVGWAAAQWWCDGRVAMHGVSYAGYTQLQAARAHPPELRAIAPIRCPAWWRPLTMDEGGALHLSLLAHWLPMQAGEAPGVPPGRRGRIWGEALTFDEICDYPPGGGTAQCTLDLERALASRKLTARPLLESPELEAGAPAYAAAWRRIVQQPLGVPWTLDPGPQPGDVPRVPVLLLSGWYDCWAQDAVAMYAALRRAHGDAAPHRLVMTPFSHAPEPAGLGPHPPDAWRFTDLLAVEWSRYHLYGQANAAAALAPVTYWVGGENPGWGEAGCWPPPGARRLTLAAVAGPSPGAGTLAPAPPDGVAVVELIADPRNPVPTRGGPSLGLPMGSLEQSDLSGGARPDVLSFTAPRLDEPVLLAGEVTASVTFVTDGRDGDVVARLHEVRADGTVWSIAEGITRARFRRGAPERLMEPGRPETVPVHLWNIAYRVRAGSRLRLDIAGSNFPRYEPNPNSGNPLGSDTAADLRVARHGVLCGGGAPTTVTVTVLEGG